MTPTETGLYGPGDFPADFVTIEEMNKFDGSIPDQFCELVHRKAVRDFALDLAEDLDARGLVLMSEEELDRIFSKGFGAGSAFKHKYARKAPPSSPNTGS